jgi:hypothetical protein
MNENKSDEKFATTSDPVLQVTQSTPVYPSHSSRDHNLSSVCMPHAASFSHPTSSQVFGVWSKGPY